MKTKLAVLALFVGSTAWAATVAKAPKVAPDISTKNVTMRVVIQWSSQATAGLADKILTLGGSVVAEYPNVHAGTYIIPTAALAVLQSDASVFYISPDRAIQHKLALTAAAINASAAWKAGYSGAGIGVAVVDSGITPTAELGLGGLDVVYSADFTGAGPATDSFGHGQHVAGIIASNGKSSSCVGCTQTYRGVAYGAHLINLRVLDGSGSGTDSNVIAAIDRAIALKSKYNIRVMNLSLGRPVFESYTQDPLCQAVEAAWKAGIVVVTAAGNDGRDNSMGTDGYGTVTAPGNDPFVITVGAMKTEGTPTRSDDLIASYSSKGPTQIDHVVKPDIVAPGNVISSLLLPNGTLADQYPGNIVPASAYRGNHGKAKPAYFYLSGTSMAAPVVSGAAAVILQAHPSFTPDQVKTLLMMSAGKTFPTSSSVADPSTGNVYTDYYDVFTVGAGYLDLGAAMEQANDVPGSGNSLSPIAAISPAGGNVTMNYDPNSVWASRSVWGARSIWGASAVWPSSEVDDTGNILGSESAIWGASSSNVSGERSIWGARSIWTKSSMNTSESVAINGEQ